MNPKTTQMMNNKIELAKEILDELIKSAYFDDQKLKELDKSIDPNSHSRTIHLSLSLKELLYEKDKQQ